MNEEAYATRLVSWNVNGLRAVMKKGFPQIFSEFGADVVALQETKLQDADRAKLDLEAIRDDQIDPERLADFLQCGSALDDATLLKAFVYQVSVTTKSA